MLVAEKVKGFDQLPDKAAEMFRNFLKSFYNAWGLEARKTIKPVEVSFVQNESDGSYLRFVYKIYGRKDWLHVKDSGTWY